MTLQEIAQKIAINKKKEKTLNQKRWLRWAEEAFEEGDLFNARDYLHRFDQDCNPDHLFEGTVYIGNGFYS